MEILAVIGFYAVIFIGVLALRRAARADSAQWAEKPR
jgi:hypothetical protein